MDKIIVVSLALALLIVASGCTQSDVNGNAQPHKLNIAATFFPLYDFTREIAGNTADVYPVVPLNADPHEYENTPQDLIKLDKADVFVTLGVKKGFAPYEEQLIQSVSPNITIVGAGAGIVQITPQGEFGDVSDDLNYNGLDPHIWVSPKNAIVMVKNIRDGLIKADPADSSTFIANADILLAQLSGLDANYTQTLSHCNKSVILAAHDAFSYLARDYGFKTYYIDGLSPEQEPTPQQIARLIDVAKQYDLKYIFYENAADPRVSNTIASQVGASTLPLNPAESTNDPNETFIGMMDENLQSLKLGMNCE